MNQPGSGGLMRGMAGGLAGGFLGSMLFSSMGQAKNADGTPASGGFGLLELVLFGGLAYLGFRWWKSRQLVPATISSSATRPVGYQTMQRIATPQLAEEGGLGHMRALADVAPSMSPDAASDFFFKVQGAWTRRDLTPVQNVLGAELVEVLSQDLSELKAKQQINRLENISVRGTEVVNNWQEAGTDYTSMRFTANLLDYTVDERSGKVVEGSDVTPVKFEEDWTFARAAPTAPWQLVGIAQV